MRHIDANRLSPTQKKELMDLAVPADHWLTVKESEKKNKFLDLARDKRKLWNMKVIVIPVIVETLLSAPKDLEKRLTGMEIRTEIL